jgi:hypothetical protein
MPALSTTYYAESEKYFYSRELRSQRFMTRNFVDLFSADSLSDGKIVT